MALMVVAAAAAVVASAETIEEWQFTDGSDKSANGTALGAKWRDAAQQEAGAGPESYKLTPKEAYFTRMIPLARAIDCTTRPVVRLEMTFTAVDYSANREANTFFQLRLQDGKTGKYAGISIRDFFKQDCIHATLIHNVTGRHKMENSGRLETGLGPHKGSHTVTLELDFKANTAAVSSSGWVWSPKGRDGVVVVPLDLSQIKTIDKLQNGFREVSPGDSITIDRIVVATR
jgi:hypothetical protein